MRGAEGHQPNDERATVPIFELLSGVAAPPRPAEFQAGVPM